MGEKMRSIGLNAWFGTKTRTIVSLKGEYMVVIVMHNINRLQEFQISQLFFIFESS
jgi:hypothetical protein